MAVPAATKREWFTEVILEGWPSFMFMKIESIFHMAVNHLKDRSFADMTTAIATALHVARAGSIS